MAVQGNYAYVGVGPRLVILDMSIPANPVVIGQTSVLPGVVSDIAVAEHYAYVADGDGGLRIIGISNPAAPEEVGFCDTPGYAGGVALAGNYAYVADGFSGGLRIINISNPAAPAEVGFYDTSGYAGGVALAGNYAYVADYYLGLRVINISSPAAPAEVGFYDTPGDAGGVALAGNYAYVADGRTGLRIINVSNPVAPAEVGFYDTPVQASGVAAAGGNQAYLADGYGGLLILRLLRDKVSVTIPPEGGSLSSTSGDAQFVFPAGAFTAIVNVAYRHLWTDQETGALAGIGRTFELSAVYSDTGQVAQLAPGQSFTMTLHYTDAEPGSTRESTLALYAWDGIRWIPEPSTVLDTAGNTITATPNHLGLFAVLGETQRLFLPVVMKRY